MRATQGRFFNASFSLWQSAAQSFERNQGNLSRSRLPLGQDDIEKARKLADIKRRSKGKFIDHLTVHVNAGKGGDGCVSFNREKFKAIGPPSGGPGGRGGSVFVLPVPGMKSLAGVTRNARANDGGPGKGDWQNGATGEDFVIRVPFGTTIREAGHSDWIKTAEEDLAELRRGLHLARRHVYRLEKDVREIKRRGKVLALPGIGGEDDDPMISTSKSNDTKEERRQERQRARDEEDSVLSEEEELEELRQKWFLIHPSTSPESHSDSRLDYAQAAREVFAEQITHHYSDLQRPPIEFDTVEASSLMSDTPQVKPILIARGGMGGQGNATFRSGTVKGPKYATKGLKGDSFRLELELKLIADVALVGFPNAGKSTLLRSLTASKTEVAPYQFTTLNPQIGAVHLYEDGSWRTGEETIIDDNKDKSSSSLTFPRQSRNNSSFLRSTFSIMDCPGLLPEASLNVGLGHAFLRHIERARALLYVVDLSSEKPWEQVQALRKELSAYHPGLEGRVWGILATKADKFDDAHKEDGMAVLARLEEEANNIVKEERETNVRPTEQPLTVIPVSGKYRMNVGKVLSKLADYLESI